MEINNKPSSSGNCSETWLNLEDKIKTLGKCNKFKFNKDCHGVCEGQRHQGILGRKWTLKMADILPLTVVGHMQLITLHTLDMS